MNTLVFTKRDFWMWLLVLLEWDLLCLFTKGFDSRCFSLHFPASAPLGLADALLSFLRMWLPTKICIFVFNVNGVKLRFLIVHGQILIIFFPIWKFLTYFPSSAGVYPDLCGHFTLFQCFFVFAWLEGWKKIPHGAVNIICLTSGSHNQWEFVFPTT